MTMQKAKFKKYASIAAIAGVALILGPVIYTIMLGIAAGFALIGTAAALLVLSALTPAFVEWTTQLKYRALKIIVDKQPVLTLQARVAEMWEELKEHAAKLTEQKRNVELLKSKSDAMAKEFPEERAMLKQRLDERERILAYRVDQFKQAKADTQTFARAVKKAEMYYEIDVQDAAIGFHNDTQGDYMTRFKVATAFDAIEKQAAQSRAAMYMELEGVNAIPTDKPVQAIVYDANNQVQLGGILDVESAVLKVEQEKVAV